MLLWDMSDYLPADKSIAQRVFLYAAMSRGEHALTGCRDLGEDSKTMLTAVSVLFKAKVTYNADQLIIESPGLGELTCDLQSKASSDKVIRIDCRNSGTTLRLLCGLVSAIPGLRVEFVGDSSLSQRPHRRLMRYLEQAGAVYEFAYHDGLPLVVRGQNLRWPAQGIDVKECSAQIKSALIHAAMLSSQGPVTPHRLRVPRGSRTHTEDLLKDYVHVEPSGSMQILSISPLQLDGDFQLNLPSRMPKDSSAAAFALSFGILSGVSLRMKGVGASETRLSFVEFLLDRGLPIRICRKHESCEIEYYAGSLAKISGFDVSKEQSAAMIDELMLAFVLCAKLTHSVSRFYGVSELRYKECDRLEASIKILANLGYQAKWDEVLDVLTIDPQRRCAPQSLGTRTIELIQMDHRMLMLVLMLKPLSKSLAQCDIPVQNVGVSMPRFMEMLRAAPDQNKVL